VATISDELSTLPFFRRVAAADVRASAPLWSEVALQPGEVLWHAGGNVDELGVAVIGELVAEVDGVEVGKVLPGELCGEASAFFAGNLRSATLRARTQAQVLTLGTSALRTLRWQRSPVYEALLEQAMLTLVRRIRATDVRIAQVARGSSSAPSRQEPSALVRFWKSLRPGGPSGACPPLEPLLRRQIGLKDVDATVLQAIGQGFVAEPVEEGQILFLEGEPGAASYILADGQVDVLRHVRGDKAELLVSLKPGDQFGVNTLVERGARSASCVAATSGWLWRMDAEAFGRLRGDARMFWRESVLGVLASQIRNANAALQRALPSDVRRAMAPTSASAPLAGTPRRGEDGFQDLLKASGFLEALPTREADLEELEVVLTEDDRRNPRKRY
jgi:CRP-like cAMP-binding protein